jgi:ligand-binding sensor domain-containing protein
MPLDFVKAVAVDPKNNVWFASCNFNTGGIVKYDGTMWTIYTPDNSALPYNLVSNIAIDQSDNVWIAFYNSLVKISNNEWKIFSDVELGFSPYYISDIQCNSKNKIIGAIDYSFSSSIAPSRPNLFVFDGKKTTLLSSDDAYSIQNITIDHNDDVWCYGWVGSGVWIGERFEKIDSSVFGESIVWTIKEDADQRIWFGTDDGIYIR